MTAKGGTNTRRRDRRVIRRSLHDFPPPTPQTTQCRLWQGTLSQSGYGQVWSTERRAYVGVHVWVWETINGHVPSGFVVMHACDQPLCYRYDHLRIGTVSDNTQDMLSKGRWRGGRKPGSVPPNKRITDEQRLEIIALRFERTSREVGGEYGITASRVRHIWSDS